MSDQIEAKNKPRPIEPPTAPSLPPGIDNQTLMALLERLVNNPANELAAEDLRERREEKQRVAKENKELALRNAESAIKGMREIEAFRNRCLHRMDNGHTRLAGQLLDNGKTVLICVSCQKTWFDGIAESDGTPLNEQLLPDGVRVGYGASF